MTKSIESGISEDGATDTGAVDRRRLLLGLAGVGVGSVVVAGTSGLDVEPAGATPTTYDGILLDQGGTQFNVKSSAYGATGNGIADDTTAIQAAITAAAASYGVVFVPTGVYAISSRLTVPQGVQIVGEGNGDIHAATTFKCTASGAGISFGTRTTGGRGGVSSGWKVDGNSVATQPLYIGLTVERTFINIEVVNAASGSVGFLLEATQNCVFIGCNVANCASIGLALDYGAAGNEFVRFESDTNATGIVLRQSGTPPTGIANGPFANKFDHAIVERNTSAGLQQTSATGNLNHFVSSQFVNTTTNAAYELVESTGGTLYFSTPYLANAAGSNYGVGLTVSNSAQVYLSDGPVFIGLAVAMTNNGGLILVDGGDVRVISTTTWANGSTAQDSGIYSEQAVPMYVTRRATSDRLLIGAVAGEAGTRLQVWADGTLIWGPGTGFSGDTAIYRRGVGEVGVNGHISFDTSGKGLRLTETGTGPKQGVATLASGVKVVSNTSVTAVSRIFVMSQDNNVVGALRVSGRTAGTSFTITSSVGTDAGVVAYEIFEPV